DDPLAAERRVGHRRDEVGHGLAGARACLDERVLAAIEGVGDCHGHLLLAVAVLAAERGDNLAQQFGGALRSEGLLLECGAAHALSRAPARASASLMRAASAS